MAAMINSIITAPIEYMDTSDRPRLYETWKEVRPELYLPTDEYITGGKELLSNIKISYCNTSTATYGGYWNTTSTSTITESTYGSIYWSEYNSETQSWKMHGAAPLNPADRLREIMRARQSPVIVTSRRSLRAPDSLPEIRARETLRRVLGEAQFRSFLRSGFVTVRGKSGKVYQIFPGHGITSVYKDGKMIDRLCAVLPYDFPPTDSVIMRFLLILNDEEEFRKLSNVHKAHKKTTCKKVAPILSLPEIFKELKAA